MIDTKELRRKLRSDDLIDHVDIHANVKSVITELLDRLEEAESDALEQARLNGMGSEREAALMAKLEAAEREREIDEGRIADLMADLNRVGQENDRDPAQTACIRRHYWRSVCALSNTKQHERTATDRAAARVIP